MNREIRFGGANLIILFLCIATTVAGVLVFMNLMLDESASPSSEEYVSRRGTISDTSTHSYNTLSENVRTESGRNDNVRIETVTVYEEDEEEYPFGNDEFISAVSPGVLAAETGASPVTPSPTSVPIAAPLPAAPTPTPTHLPTATPTMFPSPTRTPSPPARDEGSLAGAYVSRTGDTLSGSLDFTSTYRGSSGELIKLSQRTVEGYSSGFNRYNGNEFFNLAGGEAGTTLFGGGIDGDRYRRFRIVASGELWFGTGNALPDTKIRRSRNANGGLVVTSASENPFQIPLTSLGTIGQRANLQDWFVSGTGTVASITAHGGGVFKDSVAVGATATGSARLTVTAATGSAVFIDNKGYGDSIRDDSGARLSANGIWTDASDKTKKTDILPLEYGVDALMALKPVSYTWKTGGRDIGFIAQEVRDILPELVYGEEGDLSMSYAHLTALLTKAVQEQQRDIEALKGGYASSFGVGQLPSETTGMTGATAAATFDSLGVTGETLVHDLGITGTVTAGLLTVSGLDDSGSATLSTLAGPLRIQSTGNPVELVGEKIQLTSQGDVHVREGIIKGNTMVRGINISVTPTQTMVEVRFPRPRPTPEYAVSITPFWQTTAWVEHKTENGFTVRFAQAPPADAGFDWLVLD